MPRQRRDTERPVSPRFAYFMWAPGERGAVHHTRVAQKQKADAFRHPLMNRAYAAYRALARKRSPQRRALARVKGLPATAAVSTLRAAARPPGTISSTASPIAARTRVRLVHF